VTHEQTSLAFRENTMRAKKDSLLRAAMKQAADTFGTKRADAFAPVADLEALRDRASTIRDDVLANLPMYVDRFVASATRAGAVVHRANDAATARSRGGCSPRTTWRSCGRSGSSRRWTTSSPRSPAPRPRT
jgi:L-lactate utilization protein LutB